MNNVSMFSVYLQGFGALKKSAFSIYRTESAADTKSLCGLCVYEMLGLLHVERKSFYFFFVCNSSRVKKYAVEFATSNYSLFKLCSIHKVCYPVVVLFEVLLFLC